MTQPGTRIGAILLGGDGHTLKVLGFGVFVGQEKPPEIPTILNPKLQLDDGRTVWGYQCWWGSEAEVQKYIESAEAAGYEIVQHTDPL